MSGWSEEVRTFHADVKNDRIEECAEATASVLRLKMMQNPKKVHAKVAIFGEIVKEVEKKRRKDYGKRKGIRGPTAIHPNGSTREIKIPTTAFIKGNWTAIVKKCASYPNPDFNIYIVWVGGKEGGVRMGTREEFQEQQATLEAISRGVAEEHNERTDIINKKGGHSARIEVKALPLPAPDRGITRILGRRK